MSVGLKEEASESDLFSIQLTLYLSWIVRDRSVSNTVSIFTNQTGTYRRAKNEMITTPYFVRSELHDGKQE